MSDNRANKQKATVFSIQRFSTEDGPGIRTTVFFKGCPMTCVWCHNPEGIIAKPQTVWFSTKCIGCGTCEEVCKNSGLIHSESGISIDRKKCLACGECVQECPSEALEIMGGKYDEKELAEIVLKDKTFYETSGGGLTCSGGEAMNYSRFLEKFLPLIQEQGIHIALDTCGSASKEKFDRVLPFVDLVLFDIKLMNPKKHLEYTGITLEKVLESARHIKASGKPVWVRTPVIPGYTDSKENIAAIARFITEDLGGVERFDLLAFSNLCSGKYNQLDMKWELEGVPLMKEDELKVLKTVAVDHGVSKVVTSGPTRLE